jgi:protein-tyrosine phosphatase
MIHRRTSDLVYTDVHCHILPAVDDGPATLDDASRLARALADGGIGRVVATPHVSHRFPTAAATMLERVAGLRAELARLSIPLAIEPGAEIAAARVPDLTAGDLRALGLGGGRWLLLEAPLTGDFPVELATRELLDAGHGVVLAHPERCQLFQRSPRRVRDLVEMGAKVSITSSALLGAFGRPARTLALALLGTGLVANAAADAHDVHRRPPTLLGDLRAAGLADRAPAWCTTLPDALLADGWDRDDTDGTGRSGLDPRAFRADD